MSLIFRGGNPSFYKRVLMRNILFITLVVLPFFSCAEKYDEVNSTSVVTFDKDAFRGRFNDIFNSHWAMPRLFPTSPGIWIYAISKERFLTNDEKIKVLGIDKAFGDEAYLSKLVDNNISTSEEAFVHYPYSELSTKLPIPPGKFDYVILFNDVTKATAKEQQDLVRRSGYKGNFDRWKLAVFLKEKTYTNKRWLVFRTIN